MPSMSRPNSHLAVLMNSVPGALAGVLSSTTVSSMTICAPAGMIGSTWKVSSPPTLEKLCGTATPVSSQ